MRKVRKFKRETNSTNMRIHVKIPKAMYKKLVKTINAQVRGDYLEGFDFDVIALIDNMFPPPPSSEVCTLKYYKVGNDTVKEVDTQDDAIPMAITTSGVNCRIFLTFYNCTKEKAKMVLKHLTAKK